MNEVEKLKAENARLRAEIESRDEMALLAPFVDEVGKRLMLMLAVRPMHLWPEMCQAAFRHAKREMPTAAEIYRKRHES